MNTANVDDDCRLSQTGISDKEEITIHVDAGRQEVVRDCAWLYFWFVYVCHVVTRQTTCHILLAWLDLHSRPGDMTHDTLIIPGTSVRLKTARLQSKHHRTVVYTSCPEKKSLRYFRHNFIRCRSIFKSLSLSESWKFATKQSLNIPPRLKRVTTLPCEILMSEN